MERLNIISDSIKKNYYFKNEIQKQNFLEAAIKSQEAYSLLDNKYKEYAIHSTVDSLEDAHVLYNSTDNIKYQINLTWFGDELFIMNHKNNLIKVKQIKDKEVKKIIENYNFIYRSSPFSVIQNIIKKNILYGFLGDDFISDNKQRLYFRNFEGVILKPATMNIDAIKTGCYSKGYSNCLYLRIYHFLKDPLIDYMLHILRSNKVQNIIIDLRGNLGGKTNLTKKITSMFLNRPIDLNYKVRSKKEEYEQIIESEMICKFDLIYILIDKNTRSSAEFIFLRALSLAYDNLIIVGEETYGLSGQVKQFMYSDCSISLTVRRYYDLDDYELENGICPTVHKINNIYDFINNSDTQLLYTLNQLGISDEVKIYSHIS